MDEKTRAFAVETTAEIGVLRSAVSVLVADLLRRLPSSEQDAVLSEFLSRLSDVPPGTPFATVQATQFFELVAEAMPRRAERFVADVRHMLD